MVRSARRDDDPAVWSPAADDDDFGGMDWRTFRAKLVAQSQALRSVSGASQSQQTSVGLEIWQVRGMPREPALCCWWQVRGMPCMGAFGILLV